VTAIAVAVGAVLIVGGIAIVLLVRRRRRGVADAS
jgi:LPXTG-motif cell wall-anchored protein